MSQCVRTGTQPRSFIMLTYIIDCNCYFAVIPSSGTFRLFFLLISKSRCSHRTAAYHLRLRATHSPHTRAPSSTKNIAITAAQLATLFSISNKQICVPHGFSVHSNNEHYKIFQRSPSPGHPAIISPSSILRIIIHNNKNQFDPFS